MKKLKLEVYKGKDDQYYWNNKASNDRIIADGAEGYSSLQKLRQGFKSFVVKSFGIKGINRAEILDIVDKEIERAKKS